MSKHNFDQTVRVATADDRTIDIRIGDIDGMVASQNGFVNIRWRDGTGVKIRGTVADFIGKVADGVLDDERRAAVVQRATEQTKFGEEIGKGIVRGVFSVIGDLHG